MNKKFAKWLVLALLLALACLMGACKPNTTQPQESGSQGDNGMNASNEKTIFANGEYQCVLVYPPLMDTDMVALRNELMQTLKNKTGVNILAKQDEKQEYDENVFEILFGSTNRPESAAPEGISPTDDAFWQVGMVGNKLVLNGSDAYQLGVAVQFFIDGCLSGEKTETLGVPLEFGKSELKKDFTREYWDLSGVPAYPKGSNSLNANTYVCGTTIKNYSKNGHNDTSSIQQTVQRTSLSEFSAYMEKLEHFGYRKEYENNIEDNLYASYFNGDHRVYLAFNPVNSTAKVILDPTGISLEEFGYTYTPKAGERSEFYQYAIPMADGKTEGLLNCGMLLVIKCADNSVIVIDGGHGLTAQMNEVALSGFNDFLHEITQTPQGGKVRISAWYLTHYHSDHFIGFYDFLSTYGDQYELERVIANTPTKDALSWNGLEWTMGELGKWTVMLNTKYPDCKELKVHTGQDIHIADITLRVLYTHEDLLNSKGGFNSTDSNDTSTVIRVDNGKMSMMVLGDANGRTQSVINSTFTQTTLKSDILQAAHHMIYHLETLYKRVAPGVVYIPQSEELSHSSYVESGTTYQWKRDFLMKLVNGNCYFGGNETVGYAVIDGELTKCYHKQEVIGRYDVPGVVKPEVEPEV